MKRKWLACAENCIALLKQRCGESLELPAVRLVLVHMLQLYVDEVHVPGVLPNEVCLHGRVYEPTAATHHISPHTADRLMTAWRAFSDKLLDAKQLPTVEGVDKLLETLTTFRPRGPAPRPYRTEQVTSVHVALIHKFIRETLQSGRAVYNKNIRSLLAACEDPVLVSTSVVRRLLTALGYVYDKRTPQRLTEVRTEQQQQRIRKFLLEYASAARNDAYVLVFMDESYLHNHHAFDFGYYPADKTVRIARPGNRGCRLIIVHAMTAAGLLHVDDELTCESIFESNTGKRDYHTNMNGDNFMKWVTDKLIPVFEHRFPDKRMALVLDNAPYHHAHDETYVDIPTINKQKALAKMLELGMTSLTVVRSTTMTTSTTTTTTSTTITFDLSAWPDGKIPRSPKGPSTEEMRAGLKDHILAHHPALLHTRLMKKFDEKGYKLIFTPPYCPQYQPIELLWGHGKNYVASEYCNGRTLKETRAQLQDAFRCQHESSVRAHLNCASLVAHCEKEMLEWATSSGFFQDHHGSVKNLVPVEEGEDSGDEENVAVEEEGVGVEESDEDEEDV